MTTDRISHYSEAERLANAYKQAISDAEAMPDDTPRLAEERYFAASNARAMLDKAKVHAELAHVDATRDLIRELHQLRGDQVRALRRDRRAS